MTLSSSHEFRLDPFQIDAMAALDRGASVLVTAPTGAGKTVVAEHAIDLALTARRRCFYTTPVKALSNQKYRDLRAALGPERVGLLTGDHSINHRAPVVVMTTEVLRNMIYADHRALTELGWVVLDEVHYLEDTYRGPVWEEVIVHLDPEVRLVCLSATVSNASEVADWLRLVRGDTVLVTETVRPVELRHLHLVADRTSDRLQLIPTIVDGRPNREGSRFDPEPRRRTERRRSRPRFRTPRRLEVIERLDDDDLLPAIYFIFSRAGCDDAARDLHRAGVRLTDPDERARIVEIAESATSALGPTDGAVLGYDSWLRVLGDGIAAHHAGLVPAFKEAVERCFVEGLVKVVFATETLALGINMPARSVVIERLTKFTGDQHEFLTPGQYTQLTGRAGRRGIDPLGTAVTLWSPFVTFDQVASLAASSSFDLRSAFRPTYNMAANLAARHDRDHAHELLHRSFGQFQLDRSVTDLQSRLDRARREVAELTAELGPDADPDAEPSPGRRREAVFDAVSRLRPGEVIAFADAPHVVVSVAHRSGGRTRVKLVDRAEDLVEVGLDAFDSPPEVIGAVPLPSPFAPTDPAARHELARGLATARLKRRRRPAPPSPALTARQERLATARRQARRLERRIEGRSDSLVARFDAVIEVLATWGYLDGWSLTDRGQRLARVFHERDLIVAETLARGTFDGLDAPAVAGLASTLTYEHRGPDPPAPWFPTRDLRRRFGEIERIADELHDLEIGHGLPRTPAPDPTFLPIAQAWASGGTLGEVLDDDREGGELSVSGGDFVRNVRRVIDLCEQISHVEPGPVGTTAARAADALERGVVAAASELGTADTPGPASDPETEPRP